MLLTPSKPYYVQFVLQPEDVKPKSMGGLKRGAPPDGGGGGPRKRPSAGARPGAGGAGKTRQGAPSTTAMHVQDDDIQVGRIEEKAKMKRSTKMYILEKKNIFGRNTAS